MAAPEGLSRRPFRPDNAVAMEVVSARSGEMAGVFRRSPNLAIVGFLLFLIRHSPKRPFGPKGRPGRPEAARSHFPNRPAPNRPVTCQYASLPESPDVLRIDKKSLTLDLRGNHH